jgi:hypothetical protein
MMIFQFYRAFVNLVCAQIAVNALDWEIAYVAAWSLTTPAARSGCGLPTVQ